jgi:hypothetical protein
MAALSLRNTFRRPGRVALTLLTLTVSGAFFIMVYSTQYSFEHTIDTIFPDSVAKRRSTSNIYSRLTK